MGFVDGAMFLAFCTIASKNGYGPNGLGLNPASGCFFITKVANGATTGVPKAKLHKVIHLLNYFDS
jgi:hypothetical protein